ncbi:glutathione S-transferase protein [Reticulomyxa filosa]|uniref:Glutathione S-transferase protein n=1 Tax=Reticulomyxa filosa TaxID=46433 RepID=X6NHK5_RETFI|nr:glutathione S-transferase protein [Reticulomyxa filosa]|eukprot:ETO24832.1 glutathione S-transferase protein [Reticulomyxa filosa]
MAKHEDEWEVFYYHETGRAEYARILFGEAGVSYKESTDVRGKEANHFVAFGGKPSELNFPAFAPPTIRHNKIYIAQTNTIVRYVATKLHLLPSNEIDQFYCDVLMANIQDVNAEMYGKSKATDEERAEWLKTRGANWLKLFNEPLTREKNQEYYFGNKCSCADLIVTVFLQRLDFILGKKYGEFVAKPFPALHQLRERVEKRPNIQKFLEERHKAKRNFVTTQWFN